MALRNLTMKISINRCQARMGHGVRILTISIKEGTNDKEPVLLYIKWDLLESNNGCWGSADNKVFIVSLVLLPIECVVDVVYLALAIFKLTYNNIPAKFVNEMSDVLVGKRVVENGYVKTYGENNMAELTLKNPQVTYAKQKVSELEALLQMNSINYQELNW
jgi:hypothetical protein